VADASVMPRITSGNTAAPAMFIGQRCADFIANNE
jgi:choline dehydrogenase